MKNVKSKFKKFCRRCFSNIDKPSLLKIVNKEKKTNKQIQEVLQKKTKPL